TPEEAGKAKLSGGALIEGITADGPAASAGLRTGDIITDLDGERVRSARQLSRLVSETPAGRTVKITVSRDGSRQTKEVAPARAGAPFAGTMPDVQRELDEALKTLPRDLGRLDFEGMIGVTGRSRLGVAVEPLTDQLAEYFGAKSGVLV